VNHFLAAPINAERELGQAASTVFQVFGMTWSGIEHGRPTLMARVQPTVKSSRFWLLPGLFLIKRKLNQRKTKVLSTT